jgi:predicted enzyme related to lactoylglutathione lyase
MLRPVYFEIHASDPDRARQFYASVFGWVFTKWGGAALPYWRVDTGDEGPGVNGGLVKRLGPAPTKVQATNAFVWLVTVPSLAQWIAKVEEAGGSIAFPTAAVPDVGWLAYMRDPEGNVFGMIEPDPSAAP